MNLQSNKKAIDRIYPIGNYNQLDKIDKYIVYDPHLSPSRRCYVPILNSYYRNLTEARGAVKSHLGGDVPVATPYLPVNALIDIKRGKYKLKNKR